MIDGFIHSVETLVISWTLLTHAVLTAPVVGGTADLEP